MNFAIVRYILGWILKFEAGFMLLPMIVGLIYDEYHDSLSYAFTALLCLITGILFSKHKVKHFQLYAREGFTSVALGWIALSIFGALPFVLSGDIPRYIDALFECVSGLTTTGASILSDVEALSHTNLFWRSFTHWIGGMGVFVFIIAILPLMGGSTMNLMRAESTGPSVGKLVPRVRDTAKLLYIIYIGLTVIGAISLFLSGLDIFDSLTTIFGTVGTGGFATYNNSAAAFPQFTQNLITLFMILSGINYTFYYYLLRKQIKEAFSIEEVCWYLAIILLSAFIIVLNIKNQYPTWEETFRHAFFQVGSIITSTGYATTDYNLWPQLSKTILVMLMFMGACSGSTGGGIKVSRILILFKSIKKELSMMIHPRMVKKIKMNGHNVPHEVIRSTNVFIAVYFVIMLTSLLLISIDNFDFTTNITAVLATLNNTGPGFEMVGPTGNFSIYSDFSKLILMFDMLAGRLELFPMLIILVPSCWRKY